MSSYEKDISFLNRYFIYKKIRTVNAQKIADSFISRLPDEIDFEKKETRGFQEETKVANKEMIPKVKKLNKKIILLESSESPNEPIPISIQEKTQEKPKTTKTRKIARPSKKIEFDII